MFYDDENPESGETAGSNDFGPEFNLYLILHFKKYNNKIECARSSAG